jgi:endoglucanase
VRRGGLVLALGLVAVVGLIVGGLLTGQHGGVPLTVVPTCGGASLDSSCPSQTSGSDAAGQATATSSSAPAASPSARAPSPSHPVVTPVAPRPASTTPAPISRATDPPGVLAVHVSGNHLVNGAGSTIQLHGVNRSGTEYQCVHGLGIFDGPSDDASVAAMVSWHGVNTVRVPLNEDCWLGINGYPNGGNSAAQYQAAIESYVARLHAHGLYAILELHWSAPGSYQATRQEVMADADHSPTFWSEVAMAFKGDPATIFDLFNEPNSINWTCWRDGCDVTSGDGTWRVAGMQSLVTAVRTTGATNVIMLGGLNFSNDITGLLPPYRPSDPANQLAASFHVYIDNPCHTAACWDSDLAPVIAQMPIVAGEIGDKDETATLINAFTAWAEPKGISYLAWTWDTWGCGNGAVLISDYGGTPCPGYGAGYRAHLATLP